MNPIDKLQLEQFLQNVESHRLMARTVKTVYDAFRLEGFSEAQALDLTKHVLSETGTDLRYWDRSTIL